MNTTLTKIERTIPSPFLRQLYVLNYHPSPKKSQASSKQQRKRAHMQTQGFAFNDWSIDQPTHSCILIVKSKLKVLWNEVTGNIYIRGFISSPGLGVLP